MKLIKRVAVVCIVTLAMCSCMSHHTSLVIDTPPKGWHTSVEMDYPNSDTLTVRSVNLLAYYSANAPDNIQVVVSTISPDGYKAIDTVICHLPRKSHVRNYFESQTTFRADVVMRCAGNYKVTFTPTDTLDGVWAVGLNTTHNNGKR
ncbi:MAG: hypothetical protein J6R31_02830 [Rikenellaceae bacterium]|nr:hypothetical protein [Rikenellaceae bacterium]